MRARKKTGAPGGKKTRPAPPAAAPSKARPVPLPKPLWLDVYCAEQCQRHGVGGGQRMMKYLGCDGRQILLETTLDEVVTLPLSAVSLVRVHGCEHRIGDRGHLEVRPIRLPARLNAAEKRGARFVAMWWRICPWTFYDRRIQLSVPDEKWEENRFDVEGRGSKTGGEPEDSI